MERKFDRYIVKKKNEEVYLHTNVSKYGSKLSCTNGVENAQLFETEDLATSALKKYVKQTKSVGFDMFEIHEIEITYDTSRLIEGLPNQVSLNLAWLWEEKGDVEELAQNREKLEERVYRYLKREYKKAPRSFDIAALPITGEWLDVNGKTHYSYRCDIKGIEWTE